MFPLRWTGGFQRTRRWEEELEVEMTSWGTVGAVIVKRVTLRGGTLPNIELFPPSLCLSVSHRLSASLSLTLDPPSFFLEPSFPRNHSVLSLFQKIGLPW
jgi:hypothetical protein